MAPPEASVTFSGADGPALMRLRRVAARTVRAPRVAASTVRAAPFIADVKL